MSSKPTILSAPALGVDFQSYKIRKEYTPAGVRIFLNIMKEWKVGLEDACQLLDVSGRYYSQLKARQEGRILSHDRLQRISYLVGIYKALRILYGNDLSNCFVHLPNTNKLFGGSTPMSFMIKCGQPAMQKVHRLLDARAAGNW